MTAVFHFKLKDKSILSIEAIPISTDDHYLKLHPLVHSDGSIFYISIKHEKLNTFIDLTGYSPCAILYFDDSLNFEGASYYSKASDSFYCVQTQSKNIFLVKLPQSLPLNSLLNVGFSIETLDFIPYESFLSK
jgi:hypothetical protein